MQYFKTSTKKATLLKAFIWLLFVVFIFIFLNTFFIIKLFISLLPLFIPSNLKVDIQGVTIFYLFGLVRKNLIWEEIQKIKVVYKDSLFHGAFSPSPIKIYTEEGKIKKVYYRLKKEELSILREIVESKGKRFIVLNNPYIEY